MDLCVPEQVGLPREILTREKNKNKKRLNNLYLEWFYCSCNVSVLFLFSLIIWGPPTGSQEAARSFHKVVIYSRTDVQALPSACFE